MRDREIDEREIKLKTNERAIDFLYAEIEAKDKVRHCWSRLLLMRVICKKEVIRPEGEKESRRESKREREQRKDDKCVRCE